MALQPHQPVSSGAIPSSFLSTPLPSQTLKEGQSQRGVCEGSGGAERRGELVRPWTDGRAGSFSAGGGAATRRAACGVCSVPQTGLSPCWSWTQTPGKPLVERVLAALNSCLTCAWPFTWLPTCLVMALEQIPAALSAAAWLVGGSSDCGLLGRPRQIVVATLGYR